jgi:hypothetical protein
MREVSRCVCGRFKWGSTGRGRVGQVEAVTGSDGHSEVMMWERRWCIWHTEIRNNGRLAHGFFWKMLSVLFFYQ